MREDEEFGKQAFDQYLAAKGVTERIWRDGGDKREPPDYYLTAENEDFVVEVTTLDQQILTPRGIVVSRDGIDKAIKDFVKAIERDALAQGILQGEFFVWFGPLEIDLHPKRKELKSLILEQIRAMQFSKEITEKGSWETSDIEIEGEQYCSVIKISNDGNSIDVGSFPSDAKFRGEAEREAFDLLQKAIYDKCRKLSRFDKPKILILINKYTFLIDVNFYHHCVTTLNDLECFHTIFVVDAWKDNGDVIFSKNQLGDKRRFEGRSKTPLN